MNKRRRREITKKQAMSKRNLRRALGILPFEVIQLSTLSKEKYRLLNSSKIFLRNKQVSLLHSAIRGRTSKEAQEFLSNLFLVKKKWNLTNKFRTLVNKAYPNVFYYDLNSDFSHFKLSLDSFDFVNFEYEHLRAPDQNIFNKTRSSSVSEPINKNNGDIEDKVSYHLRRKSWVCSYWGNINISDNLKSAMIYKNPNFSVH